MIEDIVVIGAGGFGRETLDVIEAAVAEGASYRLLGVLDGSPRDDDVKQLHERGITYLGSDVTWLADRQTSVRFVVAIGNPVVRETVVSRFTDSGLRPISVIHPRAVIGSQVGIGEGVVIAAGVQISTNVTLGDHVHVNPGCIIGHDSELAAFVSVNPGAIVSGNVLVARGALLGAGSVVLQGLKISAGATVGAAACVTKDVESEGAVVMGIPARPRGDDDLSVLAAGS